MVDEDGGNEDPVGQQNTTGPLLRARPDTEQRVSSPRATQSKPLPPMTTIFRPFSCNQKSFAERTAPGTSHVSAAGFGSNNSFTQGSFGAKRMAEDCMRRFRCSPIGRLLHVAVGYGVRVKEAARHRRSGARRIHEGSLKR